MLETAFSFGGVAVSWLELLAFALAIANVLCAIREIHWAWPLAIVASLLYAWLFAVNRLYGEMGVNIFFALAAAWGWWQWLFGHRVQSQEPLRVMHLPLKGLTLSVLAWGLLWLLFGLFLDQATDSDVPWLDAFVTAGSVVGTVLLARKFIENWPLWLIVNAVSVFLFAAKALYLTVLLYALLFLLALAGWRRWQRVLRAHAT